MWEFISAGKAHMLVCTLHENLQRQMMHACLHHYYTHVCNIKYRLLGNLDRHSIYVMYIPTACMCGGNAKDDNRPVDWLVVDCRIYKPTTSSL